MVDIEAAQEVGHLVALCPGVNEDQRMFWHKEFLRWPRNVVRRAIDEVTQWCGDFVDRPRLLELLQRFGDPRDAEAKRQAIAAEVKALRDQNARAAKSIDQFWADVDAALQRLGPEALDQLKAAVLADLSPESRSFLAHSDPTKSHVLKAMIAERIGMVPPATAAAPMRIAKTG